VLVHVVATLPRARFSYIAATQGVNAHANTALLVSATLHCTKAHLAGMTMNSFAPYSCTCSFRVTGSCRAGGHRAEVDACCLCRPDCPSSIDHCNLLSCGVRPSSAPTQAGALPITHQHGKPHPSFEHDLLRRRSRARAAQESGGLLGGSLLRWGR
jgi:hypothetical protein